MSGGTWTTLRPTRSLIGCRTTNLHGLPEVGTRLRSLSIVALGAAAFGLGWQAGTEQARAQQIPGDLPASVLTLQDALARAIEFNPEYRKAVNRMELERLQERAAWGSFLPDLRLTYGTGQVLAREHSWVDFDGSPIENPDVKTLTSSYANQVASLNVDLFQGRTRFHALDEVRSRARVQRLRAERDLNRILADVQRQFLLAQRHKASLAVELALLSARESDFERSRRLFEFNMIGRSDLLAAELELEAQGTMVAETRGSVEKSLVALRTAIGDPSLSDFDLERQLPEPFDPESLDLNALVERALQESPVLGEAEATVSADRAALGRQRSRRWPSLTLFSSVVRHAYESERAALFDMNPGGFNGSLGVSISIPVFDRFATRRAIGTALVQLENANETVRQTALELEEQIRARYIDLITVWVGVQERSRRRQIANERLRIVEEEYELETKTIEDLRAAIQEDARASRDEVIRQYEFASALLALHEAAGIVAREAGLHLRDKR